MRKQFSYAIGHLGAAVALVMAASSTAIVLAQTPTADEHHQTAAEQGKPAPGAMMADRQGMMGDQKEMMARMAAADKKLAELVARMNSAQGDQKVAAMAAVINELVAQRTQMQQMMGMQGGMMDQMMSHMSAMHGSEGMAGKKTPEPAKDAGEADHSAHHPDK